MSLSAILGSARRALGERHASAWVAGGAVRDALLGREPADLDLAVDVEDIGELARAIARGAGAAAVTLDAERDVHRVASRDDAASIDLTPADGGIGPDLLRRDFTINAMALPLQLWPNVAPSQVVDPAGGLEDLRAKRLRAVSEEVLAADPVRMARAVRLCAELGFEMEPQTAAWTAAGAGRITSSAGERVRDELVRLMRPPGTARHLRLLDRLGLLTQIIPELEAARGAGQPKEHYWDVLEHSLEAVGKVQGVLHIEPLVPHPEPMISWGERDAAYADEAIGGGRTRADALRLAALLHDVAKPACKTVEADGRIRFLGHPKAGAVMTEGVMERLCFSNRERRLVAVMVREHLRPEMISREPDGPSRRALYRYFRDAGDAAIDTLYLSYADFLAAKGPRLDPANWAAYAERIHGILVAYYSRVSEAPAPRIVDGHDLMGALGLEPGPIIGRLMETLREAQAAGEIETRPQAIALAGKLLAEGSTAGPEARPQRSRRAD